tara:strand:+ start:15 stop:680 length:666 start_codon:yes stop_codon:yes gene_type:complete
VANSNELREVFIKSNYASCILEKKLPLEIEVSVITARSMSGNHVFFPIAENEHVNGILDKTISPGRVSDDIACKVRNYAHEVAIKLNYVGVLAVEFFIVEDNVYINEIAPRPHNSGHYSLDACTNNQFDLQVRALTDLELLDPGFHSNTVMINLLGDTWFKENKLRNPNFNILLNEPGVNLHMYGKEEPRKGRKMAHFNLSGNNLNDLLVKASRLKQKLSN